MHSIFFNQCPAETFSPKEAAVFGVSESHLVVAFGILPQNFGRWTGPMSAILSLYYCRMSGRDTQTLPAVIKKFELSTLTDGGNTKISHSHPRACSYLLAPEPSSKTFTNYFSHGVQIL